MDLSISKTPVLIDCFPFNDEIDMLRFRLEYYKDIVSYFAISEADHTYSGNPKPYVSDSDEFRQMLKETGCEDRVAIIKTKFDENIINESKKSGDALDLESNKWLLDFSQRNNLVDLAEHFNKMYPDKCAFMFGDMDEFIGKNKLHTLLTQPFYNRVIAYTPIMDFFYYDATNISTSEAWLGTVFINGFNVLKAHQPSHWRHIRMNYVDTTEQRTRAHNGFHISYFGGRDRILKKIQSLNESQQLLSENNVSDEKIIENINNKVDMYDRGTLHFGTVDKDWWDSRYPNTYDMFPPIFKKLQY